MDDILPSAGIYKINLNVNDILLDECSYITSSDSIRPFFAQSVSNDRDVTSLIITIKNTNGINTGSKVIYELERNADTEQQDDSDIILTVKNLDEVLPAFSLPKSLAPGVYTISSHVMSGKNILQRTEKSFYYIGAADFSYKSVRSFLPGIAENAQIIPTQTVVMLEADMDFSETLNPYIVWYEDKKKVSEGFFADGAGQLFWRTPEQSGFFTLSAEVYPMKNFYKLPGYKKETTLVISSLVSNVNLITNNNPQLVHWYKFEGDLIDSKAPAVKERNLKLFENNIPIWRGYDGTYGLVSGYNNVSILPKVSMPNDVIKTWQTFVRFKPINDGCVFNVQFGAVNTFLDFDIDKSNFVLTITSPKETVSQVISYNNNENDESGEEIKTDSFITAGISFSVLPGILSANINVTGDTYHNSSSTNLIAVEADINDGFQIALGQKNETKALNEMQSEYKPTVIWDEFALYYKPPLEGIISFIKSLKNKNQMPDDSAVY